MEIWHIVSLTLSLYLSVQFLVFNKRIELELCSSFIYNMKSAKTHGALNLRVQLFRVAHLIVKLTFAFVFYVCIAIEQVSTLQCRTAA